jgi:hypothetical protein
MAHHIDINADLTLSSDDQDIAITASGSELIIWFKRSSSAQMCREFRRLDRLQFWDRWWNFTQAAGWRVYIRYGALRFKMPRPALCRVMVRFLSLLSRG